MSQARTPIVRRIEHLQRQLAYFLADREARLLCWALAPDEQRLFEGFLQLRVEENSPEQYLTVSDEPFSSSLGHGIAVVRDLKTLTDAEAEALAEADTYDVVWTPPALPRELKPRKGQPPADPLYLRDALLSLQEHQCTARGHLLLCLRPDAIQDVEQYAQWLGALTSLLDSPYVRVIVSCERSSTWAQTLVRTYSRRARWLHADLHMPGALEEVCAAAEDAEESSGRYRFAFVRGMNALSQGNLAAARQHADQAAETARVEGWLHLEFAAHQLLGSGALSLGQTQEAIGRFESAERVVLHDLTAGKNSLTPLLLQARLCKASAWMTLGDHARAAHIFEREALPPAHVLGDRRMELECLRLAAACLEAGGDTGEAWKRAVAAVAVGASMPAAARADSNLALVGEALLRMLKGFGHGRQRAAIRDKFQELLGPDWQKQTLPGSATAEDMLDSPLARKAPLLIDSADLDPIDHTLDISASLARSALKKAAAPKPAVENPANQLLALEGAPVDQTWDASALRSDPSDRTWDFPAGLPPEPVPSPGPAPSVAARAPEAGPKQAVLVAPAIIVPPPVVPAPPSSPPPAAPAPAAPPAASETPVERTWVIPGGPAPSAAPRTTPPQSDTDPARPRGKP